MDALSSFEGDAESLEDVRLAIELTLRTQAVCSPMCETALRAVRVYLDGRRA